MAGWPRYRLRSPPTPRSLSRCCFAPGGWSSSPAARPNSAISVCATNSFSLIEFLHPVGLLIVGLYIGLSLIGARTLAPSFYFGFDGIAFDQYSNLGRLWSAVIATVILLMVVRYEHGQRPSMLGGVREFAARSKYLLAGIVVTALFQILLSPVQGLARWWVYLFWTGTEAPGALKAAVYFIFIFGFATLRLWGTVAILIFALRESYRRGVPAPAAGKS